MFRASMWQDLLAAIALMLVFEGILPFLNPLVWRRVMLQVAQLTDGALRLVGLSGMLFGVILLYLVR